MVKSFENKVTLVTGGGSGIGRVAACAFSEEGAKVVVSDITQEQGQETTRMITKSGGKAVFVSADVTKPVQLESLINQIDRLYGRLDFALNNAGLDGVRARTGDYPEETWNSVLNVNLTGVFLSM